MGKKRITKMMVMMPMAGCEPLWFGGRQGEAGERGTGMWASVVHLLPWRARARFHSPPPTPSPGMSSARLPRDHDHVGLLLVADDGGVVLVVVALLGVAALLRVLLHVALLLRRVALYVQEEGRGVARAVSTSGTALMDAHGDMAFRSLSLSLSSALPLPAPPFPLPPCTPSCAPTAWCCCCGRPSSGVLPAARRRRRWPGRAGGRQST